MQWNRISCMVMVTGISMLIHPGCGGSDQPELGQVTGTIKLDGRPLSGIAVVFQPQNGRPARGTTDAEGKYELTYIRNTKGTKVGPNRVEIAPSEEDDPQAEEFENAGQASRSATNPSNLGKPMIPLRYNVRSELKADVKPGKNTFDFNLESKPID